MGLIHPTDLEAWQRWQSAQHRLRHLKTTARDLIRRGAEGPTLVHLTAGGPAPRVAVVLESRNITSVLALLAPLQHLPPEEVLVLSPTPVADLLDNTVDWHVDTTTTDALAGHLPRSIDVVLAFGHYLAIGAAVHPLAVGRDIPFVVVQHGLLTPHNPPLPSGAHLLAFSEADADYWRSGRTDVTTEVVGSQLLWRVATGPQAEVDAGGQPVFLGQLHGAELPRRDMARTIGRFCSETGASYRPHPSERDRLSVLQHRLWERRGITVDRTRAPLAESTSPVVSIFSTGVLEAAARGIPAWVTHDDPPPWLRDFWSRYGMSRWGEAPTPSPRMPDGEPARLVAERLSSLGR